MARKKLNEKQKSDLKKTLKKWKTDTVQSDGVKIVSTSSILTGAIIAGDFMLLGGMGFFVLSLLPGMVSYAGLHLMLNNTEDTLSGDKKATIKAPMEVVFTLDKMQSKISDLFNKKSNSNKIEIAKINSELELIKADLKYLEPTVEPISFWSNDIDLCQDLKFDLGDKQTLNIEEAITSKPSRVKRLKDGFAT